MSSIVVAINEVFTSLKKELKLMTIANVESALQKISTMSCFISIRETGLSKNNNTISESECMHGQIYCESDHQNCSFYLSN
jgi:hypothetical protein